MVQLNIQELKTISHNEFNIKLFVINNGGYVSMHNWADSLFKGRRLDTAADTGDGTLNVLDVINAVDTILSGQVAGCTDPDATNYNADASIDDGTCEFEEDNIMLFDRVKYVVSSVNTRIIILKNITGQSAFGRTSNFLSNKRF